MQIKYIAAAPLALTACLAACVSPQQAPSETTDKPFRGEAFAITHLLKAQQNAWNAGDIDRFMDGYWNSPELRFASGGDVTFGWQATRDRYHKNYANRALMGTLTFSDLEVIEISDDAAIVHGGWALARDGDTPSGLFTLLLRKIDGAWKVVSDTTTSAG